MSATQNGYVHSRILKFQMGYLLNEGKGHSSETALDVPRLKVAEDLIINHLSGSLRFNRVTRGILVQGQLSTSLYAECNRCLDEALVTLDVLIEELFVYPPEPGAEFSVGEDGILDLAPLLREEIILDTPIGILCKPDCAGLCPNCGHNLNDGPCDCSREDTNPQFAALKALKDRLSGE